MNQADRPRTSTWPMVLREAFSNLAAHPLRSLLTVLSVTFGASVLLVLMAYGAAVPPTTTDFLRAMGGRELVVEPARSWRGQGNRGGRDVRIRYADLPAIVGACPSIAGIAPVYSPGRGGPVFSADRSWPWARLEGVGHAYRQVTDLRIVSGRWFTAEEEAEVEDLALISLPLQDGLFGGRSPLGETIDRNGRRFRVIGVFESSDMFAYSIFVPYSTAMEMGDSGGFYVSELAFAPRREDLTRSAISEIRMALGTLYSFDPWDPSALEIEENVDFVEKVRSLSLGLEGMVLIIAVLALVLGCLGAANVVGISVSERTSELGLRKALGATSARIRLEVLTEVLLLCLAGGLLGVFIGGVLITVVGPLDLTSQTRLIPQVEFSVFLLALLVLTVTATLAGLPAANRASRLDPVTALRTE